LWCVDFKGHFALGDKTRCHPLMITDHVPRYLLKCEALAPVDPRGPRVV
jgi:putative transposase